MTTSRFLLEYKRQIKIPDYYIAFSIFRKTLSCLRICPNLVHFTGIFSEKAPKDLPVSPRRPEIARVTKASLRTFSVLWNKFRIKVWITSLLNRKLLHITFFKYLRVPLRYCFRQCDTSFSAKFLIPSVQKTETPNIFEIPFLREHDLTHQIHFFFISPLKKPKFWKAETIFSTSGCFR